MGFTDSQREMDLIQRRAITAHVGLRSRAVRLETEVERLRRECEARGSEIERLREDNRSLQLELDGLNARYHTLWSKHEGPAIKVKAAKAAKE